MITIVTANWKGGVGKTTSTIHLATALANEGKKVVTIDLDPQSNLTKGVGIEADEHKDGAYELFKGNKPTMYKTGNLAIIPTSIRLSMIPQDLSTHVNPNGVLRKALKPFANMFDYALIDTPPNLDKLTLNALVASDYVIIPCQCQVASLEGLQEFQKVLHSVKEINSAIQILAVLPTIYTGNRSLEKDALSLLKEQFGSLCQEPIPDRVEYPRAYAEHRVVTNGLYEYWVNLAKLVIEKAGA